MWETQNLQTIQLTELIEKVSEMKKQNCRLVQICCSKIGATLELNYSFDKEFKFTNFKLVLPLENTPEVPSVSSVYGNSFLYENEIQDLFGVKFSGLTINFNGNFYKTAIQHPFRQQSENVKEVKND